MTKADTIFKENIRRILYEGVFSENARPRYKNGKVASRSEAVENIHFPKSGEDFNKAFRRLAFEEIFEIILASKINKL